MHNFNPIVCILLSLVIYCKWNEAKKVLTIKFIETKCTNDYLNITLNFNKDFKGVIYTKNFRDNSYCTSNVTSSLQLNTRYCGVKSTIESNFRKVYSVIVIVQQDRKLQQIHDLETKVSCILHTNNFNENKSSFIKSTVKKRNGRFLDETNSKISRFDQSLKKSKVWLQFESNQTKSKSIKVGDLVKISIHAILPKNVDWRVSKCEAGDGTGKSAQLLLDLKGCPLDINIMPQLRKIDVNDDQLKFLNDSQKSTFKHQQAFAEFVAFKFPDRDTLNIICHLEICNVECLHINCNDTNRKPKYDKSVIDDIEIFNSIDILEPGVEVEHFLSKKYPENHLESSNLLSEQICISSIKLAFTFSGLGLIFLCALIVSVICLAISRRYSNRASFYTRSTTFTNSSSNNSNSFSNINGNSDSSQKFIQISTPSSSRWSYGRMFDD